MTDPDALRSAQRQAGPDRPTVRESAVTELAELVAGMRVLAEKYEYKSQDRNETMICRAHCAVVAAELRGLLKE